MACANSADLGAVWSGSTPFAIPLSFQKQLHKKQILGQKSME